MLKEYGRAMAYYARVVRELIFPRHCAVCGNVIDTGYLCPECRKGYLFQKYVQYEPREEYLAGQAEPMACDVLKSVLLLYKYDGMLKDALHEIKFNGNAALLPLLREEAEAGLPAAKLRWLGQYDVITCIPTSPERRARRGFDLPEALFAPLLEQRGGEFQSQVLERVRPTAPLFELAPQERRSELAGCFALSQSAQRLIAGKRVLLCNDIYTTGSTMAGAAGVLLRAGAAEVHGLALCAASSHW